MARTLTALGPAVPEHLGFEAVSLTGREGVNVLFEYELLLKAPASYAALEFSPDDFIGLALGCRIQLDGNGLHPWGGVGAGERQINALVADARILDEEGAHVPVRLLLRPWLHLADLRTNCRIFQNQSIVDMLDLLLADYDFPVVKRLFGTYPKRDYQTQFNETDFGFFSRLCEEWGINYHFEHADGAHRLVLCDELAGYLPSESVAYREVEYHAPGWRPDREYLNRLIISHQLVPRRYTARDYDYTRPGADLTASRDSPPPPGQIIAEVYEWHAARGGFHVAQPEAGTAGPNRPEQEGRFFAGRRIEALCTTEVRIEAGGNLRGMVPGCTFRVVNPICREANAEHLVLDTRLLIEEVAATSQGAGDRAQGWQVQVDLTAHPLTKPLRPPLTRKKPCAGPQTAVVVGPPGEDIWTDALGRIKIQFPWDREGQRDGQGSCWVRVFTGFAGNEFGESHLPRIGQEVQIHFVGGNPDLPICAGRLFNQLNQPPWELPGQSALTGWRSRELSPGLGNAASGRSNHLLLDDTSGRIQVQLKSDHLSSSISLGHVARVDGHAGRQDLRGEGFELRSDGHGAIRAGGGLLITTEGRDNAARHLLDSEETQRRLREASELHRSGAEQAQRNKAQGPKDQAEVAKALRQQADEVAGRASADAPAQGFPELTDPHLVLASPAGIEFVSGESMHVASVDHTAITSGKDTSIVSADSLLAVAYNAIRLFAAEKGIEVIAREAEIRIKALSASLELLARDEINLSADKISIQATTSLTLAGGGSYMTLDAQGVTEGTVGDRVAHAAQHSLAGPKRQEAPPFHGAACAMREADAAAEGAASVPRS